jgi:hypothetical protein
MSKRKNIFDLPFDAPPPKYHRQPYFFEGPSDVERIAARTIKKFLSNQINQRRGTIGTVVGTAGLAYETYKNWKAIGGGESKRLRGNTRQTELTEYYDISRSYNGKKISPDNKETCEAMPTPMEVNGEGTKAVDRPFDRDAESEAKQKAIAAMLWNRAPKIYDDSIIVRMPLQISINTFYDGNVSNANTWTPSLATFTGTGPLKAYMNYLTNYTVKLNSILEPFPFYTGYKPQGYSHYANLYSYYQVLETRWTYHTECLHKSTSGSDPQTSEIPLQIYAQETDNNDLSLLPGGAAGVTTVSFEDMIVKQLGATNAADQVTIVHGPVGITGQTSGITPSVKNAVTFSGIWTPAKFDDLQVDVTRQPMTLTSANPNWINYLKLGYINYNTANTSPVSDYHTTIHLEFLVHFKKLKGSKYLIAS